MEEPKVITIDDVMDSTVMHINKGNPLFARESKGNPHGTTTTTTFYWYSHIEMVLPKIATNIILIILN